MSNALGRVDGEGSVSRAELLENCRIIAEATDLPVNADLENGYADDPKEAATILRDAAEMGIVGGSIEDWSGERIYDFHHAVERVAAGPASGRLAPAGISGRSALVACGQLAGAAAWVSTPLDFDAAGGTALSSLHERLQLPRSKPAGRSKGDPNP